MERDEQLKPVSGSLQILIVAAILSVFKMGEWEAQFLVLFKKKNRYKYRYTYMSDNKTQVLRILKIFNYTWSKHTELFPVMDWAKVIHME